MAMMGEIWEDFLEQLNLKNSKTQAKVDCKDSKQKWAGNAKIQK